MAYITQTDLENAISPATVLELFNDDDGTINQVALQSVLNRASLYVDSYVSKEYPGPWPCTADPIPAMVAEAALAYASAFAFRRHPEYVRRFGEGKRETGEFQRAEQLCANLVSALQKIVDLPGTPEPVDVTGVYVRGTPQAPCDGIGSGFLAGGFSDY